MGSYGTLSLGGIGLYTAKNAVYDHMLNLFSPKDYIEETIVEVEDLKNVKKLVTTCGIARKRLDIIGYSLKRASDEFEHNMTFLSVADDDYPIELFDILSKFYDYSEDRPNKDLIKNMTLKNFNNAVKEFFKNPNTKTPSGNLVLDYIIKHMQDYNGVGFPVLDSLLEVRIILECLRTSDVVEYHLSEIIDNGYAEVQDIFSFWNGDRLKEISNKTIILTEGSTDIYVLRKSLNLLYPELSHLYKFFDFDYTRSPGSTSSLVNLLKGFISAGIGDRFIALFDNDTAAYEALSNFEIEKITKNIRIMHLPNLVWAMEYPTLGPTGEVKADINKLACSIELFMGKNLLIKHDKLIPIQWTGFCQKLNRYQGEILYKKDIYNNFCDIVNEAEINGLENVKHDWEQLKYLWETIFSVFNC